MAYRTIEPKIWQDRKVRGLSPTGKLLFVYAIANIHAHYGGLYYLSKATMAGELNIPLPDITKAVGELIKAGMIKYDNENDTIWVLNMAKYQCKGDSKSLWIGISRHIETLESPMVSEFAEIHYTLLTPC